MARIATVERQPAGTGNTLVVMVGLGVAFLLFIAFLNVVKSGDLLNDSNLLYAALIFYAGAGTLYLGFGITGTPSYIRFASLATWAGLLANTGAVARRWYEAGHPPFASIYEMLRGRRAAYFAILGFAVVMFSFFGVTYLLPGLHAYA
jgi:ABC-type transport system involved in cytochrome c biogenesis permease subunit